MTDKKLVFLTGATGTMGGETMKQLLDRKDRFDVRILARDSEKNRNLLKEYEGDNLEIVWGDMTDYDTIKKCVDGADYVLHIGAMVSPAADRFPEKCIRTNLRSTLNIIKAIKEQDDPDSVKLAYVGTVAMTGYRPDPIHWGRIGDPIAPSMHDYYALSKVYSELALYESGLKYWVSIRQTGQHPSSPDAATDPIMWHQPPNNVLEWSTSVESGIAMANLCEDWVPEEFWRHSYNLSSGPKYRKTTWEFMNMNLNPFGIEFTDVYDASMMAKYNFHGQYYSDGDLLNDFLKFRVIDGDEYWAEVDRQMRAYAETPEAKATMPNTEQMRENNIQIGKKELGTYWMFENDKEDFIKAFFGSREQQAAIPDFDEGYELYRPDESNVTYLDHGYDEEKGIENLTKEDLDKAAAFRGGKYLEDEAPADIYTPVRWADEAGNEFSLSTNAILHGGHWSPELLNHKWSYGKQAENNKFLAQIWEPVHTDEKDDFEIPILHSAYEIYKELKDELELDYQY